MRNGWQRHAGRRRDGCQLTLSGVTDPLTNTNGVAGGEDGTAAIVNCAAGQVIKFTASGCTVSYGNQANGLGVKYDNEFPTGKPDDVLATVTLDNLTYTASDSLCDFLGYATPGGSNALLTERVTLKAFEDVNGAEGATQINLTQSWREANGLDPGDGVSSRSPGFQAG
jgi:hypothetical protein